ncbi:MAG TPA: DEAD/DEAH box helicase [Streptosporangiaceae bacterium]|nr:DEAD/DEAH box helicase [Streptosporangiaceae bacterium]
MTLPASPAQRYAKFQARPAWLTAFQALYSFEFDGFQIEACEALHQGRGVLVAAPTGSGKTVVGEFAVHLALAQGSKCFYTTPIKALSNQKYGDLVRRYGADKVGLLTGDNSVNGEAPVVVMTTEVLRNMLYAGSATLGGLGYVVLDEVHYLADRFRGAVWEEVIIHLPPSVQVVALSATVSNAEEFGDWLDAVRGGTTVIVDEHRPVPLWQHMLAGNRLYDLFVDTGPDSGELRVNPELVRIAQRDEWTVRKAPGRPGRGGHRPRRFAVPRRPAVIERLDRAGLLPAITFIFSRAGCDAAAAQCLAAGLRLTTPEESAQITEVAERRTADIPADDLRVLGYAEWLTGLQRGIAAHHAGLLPTFKEVVEELFEAGLIRAVFATETLALGINMPARTVVIERLDKWNGETHANLTPGEYTQLTGRAGRRGIDVEGHAVVLWQPGTDPTAVAGLAGTRTYPLTSSFKPSYNMAVNLTGQFGRARAATLLESSFAQFQADRAVVPLARQLRLARDELDKLASQMSCERGDITEYAQLRADLTERERRMSRERSVARRAEAERSIEQLRRGDIIQVTAGRRAGVAVVLEQRPVGSLLVLTSGRQVRKLSAADFTGPVQPIDRVRIPAWFSERSPKHRRDLSVVVRDRLAGRDLSGGRGSGGGHPGDGARRQEDAELAALRRRLREHPCHHCPDREQHVRQAERYRRQQREVAGLERRVAGRTHVIARTFERVCAVLDRLGYLRTDTVTAEGRRLGGLYTELDLLAAECLRRGLWDGLTAPELAACVSALSFEARRADDASPPKLPPGRVREVFGSMVRVWGELDQMERDNGLSFLREPDLGFAWTAYRWARGDALQDVLDETPDVAAGDFVRWTKQVIDLLDQVAAAAAELDGVAAKARAAAESMRRGVIAYTSVG